MLKAIAAHGHLATRVAVPAHLVVRGSTGPAPGSAG
jgi:hypothetical protein